MDLDASDLANTIRADRRLSAVGTHVLRYGLVALLLLWGGMKFTELVSD